MAATMSEPRHFTCVLEADTDEGWHAYIPTVPGCRTWGCSIVAARRYIREALATCVDVLGENAARIARDAILDEKVALKGNAKAVLEGYLRARGRAAHYQDLAQSAAVKAAKKLTADAHLSLRDAGELLGLSHERVSQVITMSESRTKTPGSVTTATKVQMRKAKQPNLARGAV